MLDVRLEFRLEFEVPHQIYLMCFELSKLHGFGDLLCSSEHIKKTSSFWMWTSNRTSKHIQMGFDVGVRKSAFDAFLMCFSCASQFDVLLMYFVLLFVSLLM